MMPSFAQGVFAEVASRLEDLHSIAIEGRSPDNAPDIEAALSVELRSGLAAIDHLLCGSATALAGEGS